MLNAFSFSFYLKLKITIEENILNFTKQLLWNTFACCSVTIGVKSITIVVSIAYCPASKAKHSKIVNHTCTLKMCSVAPAIIIVYWNLKNCNKSLF